MRAASFPAKKFLCGIVTLVALCLAPRAKALTKIDMCVPVFHEEFLTLVLAIGKDRGIFGRNGIDLRFNVLDARQAAPAAAQAPFLDTALGPIGLAKLSDHNVAKSVSEASAGCDLGTTHAERILSGGNLRLADTQPLFLSTYGESYDTHLVVAKDSSIKTVKDLKGKTVRMGQLLTFIALNNILQESGLKMQDVKQVTMALATTAANDLESGKVDAVMTYVPTMPVMLASGKVRVLKSNIVSNYVGKAIPHSLIIANRAFAKSSPRAVTSFEKAVAESVEYATRNPHEAIMGLQRNTSLFKVPDWSVSKLTAEKAGSFVGKIEVVPLGEKSSPESWSRAMSAMRDYGQKLVELRLTNHKPDLASWLGSQ